MKIISKIVMAVASVILLAGCATQEKVIYFQNIDQLGESENTVNYEPTIKKDDLLSIIVTGPYKDATMPYNLTLTEQLTSVSDPTRSTLSYLVDANGDITFPTLGKIHVEGMTRMQLADYITKQITGPVSEPIVVVTFMNYRITVLGEVKNPGTYTMPSEKTTILQALGMAGDLSITAQRNDIILIRETDGVQEHIKLDLRDASLLSSPYYYMSQNDVIYVPPTRARIANSTNMNSLWSTILSAVSVMTSVIVLTTK